MNITKKRLHKIKKSNNQSKRNIHKKPNKKNKKNKASNGRKRPHNLKNKTLKIKRGPKQTRKVNVVFKKQLGGGTKEEEGIEVSEKTLWTPSSEEEDTVKQLETSSNEVDISIEKTLWTPSSEDIEDEDEDEAEDEDEDEAEDNTTDESETSISDNDKKEAENDTTNESETSISDNDKKEAEKEILLTNLSNNDDWGIFMNALLKTACVIEKKNGEKEEEKEEKVEVEEEKEETKEEDTGQNGEDNNSMELFNKLSNYYSGKDNNKRDDELYKNAKTYYDIIKSETNDDMDCDSIKFTEGYDNLNAMMEDTDTASERLNLMVVIHNQVILEKDNRIETILKKKQDKDDETKSQTGGANDILKWFKGFKKDMIKAKYYVEGDVFIPKTNVILKLNFSNEKQLANPDITTQFIKSDQASNNAVGDMMQEIIYSLSNHKEEANKVKTQLEGKRGTNPPNTELETKDDE
jgi:hypothetical protein